MKTYINFFRYQKALYEYPDLLWDCNVNGYRYEHNVNFNFTNRIKYVKKEQLGIKYVKNQQSTYVDVFLEVTLFNIQTGFTLWQHCKAIFFKPEHDLISITLWVHEDAFNFKSEFTETIINGSNTKQE